MLYGEINICMGNTLFEQSKLIIRNKVNSQKISNISHAKKGFWIPVAYFFTLHVAIEDVKSTYSYINARFRRKIFTCKILKFLK